MNIEELTNYIINNNTINYPHYLYFDGNITKEYKEHFKIPQSFIDNYDMIFLFDMIYDIDINVKNISFNGKEITINGILNDCNIWFRKKCYINNEINNTNFNTMWPNGHFIINYPIKYLKLNQLCDNITITNNTDINIIIIYDNKQYILNKLSINRITDEEKDILTVQSYNINNNNLILMNNLKL